MIINNTIIKEMIRRAHTGGSLEVRDHRNNTLQYSNKIFKFNGISQPKSMAVIESTFIEAFRISRYIKLDGQEYIRKANKWIKKENLEE